MKNAIVLAAVVISLGFSSKLFAQYDTAYYLAYPNKVVGRVYLSRKFTALQLKNNIRHYNLNYLPNTTLNLGVGATYHWATLNLAYGFGFLNPHGEKGKTKYLDMQFHSYGRKILLDVFGQFYRGFYLSDKKYNANDMAYYVRPDLRVNLIGTSAQFVTNNKRFSYRAAFLQNEWQKKSAGTFLIGMETYIGWIKADSAFAPKALTMNDTDLHPRYLSFFEIGPNAGYAYTLVMKKHFYVTASASVSMDYGRRALKDYARKETSYGFSPNTFLRFFGGYNSSLWAVNLVYVIDNIRMVSEHGDRDIFLKAGNYRLHFTYRFKPSKKTKKVLKVVDEVGE